MVQVRGYAAADKSSPMEPFSFERREPGPKDVQIEILFCGICHSDVHQIRDDWSNSLYPMVPGHEIVGRVAKVGTDV
ncbi:MAG: alcohol dehydrogenase catalytic domain-containing protein, partial [Gemmatimonadaceae bacterium]|nr:alcohol dehydrogenase catalytic domain-containing protein [Gloeobacterales cyanobacterium ES-bin-141]